MLSQQADEKGPHCFFSLYRLQRISDEAVKHGKATPMYMDERGEGEVNPTKLDSDSQLSQLEVDSITCEYFIVTS